MAGQGAVDGTPFGRYRLVELLGRGGMGEVWRAHDTDTDRIVAIKLLPPHFSDNEDFKHRFRREAHAAARLNSPHVVPIHTYGEIDGRLYVDMRLIEGRDLQTVLADGPMEPSRAVRIIEGVALALHAAHEVGLVHRDVKPSNILLDRNDFAYLIDFGLARAADETRLTKSGNTIGTFAYIAPERLGARTEEDARADIYSLACVLYECLTGHPPFDEDTMAALVAAHLNTPPPQPSTTQPNVPAQFDAVIAKGMAKEPDHRYATTVELAGAAQDAITAPILRPKPSPAPDSPTEQAGSVAAPWTHNPYSAPTLRAAPPVRPAALPPPLPPASKPPDQPAPSRSKTWVLASALAGVFVLALVVVIVAVNNHHDSQSPSAQLTSSATSSAPVEPPAAASSATSSAAATPTAAGPSTQMTGANGAVYPVWGPILDKYNSIDYRSKLDLGAPIGNQQTNPDGGIYQQFDGGVIVYETQAYIVWGKIRDVWNALGGSQGRLGYPTSDETDTADGQKKSTFEHGTITWKPGDAQATVTYS